MSTVQLELHPEVWAAVGALIASGFYVSRVMGPLAMQGANPPAKILTKKQKVCFTFGVLILWLSADWPIHDIAEKHLYFVHMAQHLLISFVVPPLLLLATPEWLARLVLADATRITSTLRVLCKPVVAGVIFNAIQVLTHWQVVVNMSVDNGLFHYFIHLLVFITALAMWVPVVGVPREWQLPEPGKMVYLFMMSIVPTVPAAWLTFAEGAVYSAYDNVTQLWGISVTSDQQAAGVVMKVIGGGYLWVLIAVLFFRWSAKQHKINEASRRNRYSHR